MVLTDVRAVAREGFDRVVLEFAGTKAPGWVVNYVQKARLEGSGETVTLDGDAILSVFATGTTFPAPNYYTGPQQFEPENTGAAVDVFVAGTFEGDTNVFVGITGARAPFRVFARVDPPRLLVDIAGRDRR